MQGFAYTLDLALCACPTYPLPKHYLTVTVTATVTYRIDYPFPASVFAGFSIFVWADKLTWVGVRNWKICFHGLMKSIDLDKLIITCKWFLIPTHECFICPHV